MVKIIVFLLLVVFALAQCLKSKPVRARLYNWTNCNEVDGYIDMPSNGLAPDLSIFEWDKTAHSVSVTGAWVFFQGKNYDEENEVYIANEWFFDDNDDCYTFDVIGGYVSSLRVAGPADDYNADSITFYTGWNFKWKEESVSNDRPFLELSGNISSLITTGESNWTVYDEPNYQGIATCISPNLFVDNTELHNPSIPNGSIASVKKKCQNELPPEIQNTDDDTNVTLFFNQMSPGQKILGCIIEGTLPIKIKWLKGQLPMSNSDPDFKIQTHTEPETKRTISDILLRHVNFLPNVLILLNCEAINDYGRSDITFALNIIDDSTPAPNPTTEDPPIPPDDGSNASLGMKLGIGIGILVTATIFITIIVYTVRKHFKSDETGLKDCEIGAFFRGGEDPILISELEAAGTINQTLLSKPYDKAFEIRRTDIKYDSKEVLGVGQFGMVFKGVHKNVPVAVKTVKPGTDKVYLKALLCEIKILIYIKGHPNATNIIGAYTKDLRKGLVFLLLEFCPMGSLMKYLQEYREKMSLRKIENDTAITEDSSEGIDLRTMVSWSYQIASVMEYLSFKNVVHGDLATRNILLYTHAIVKVADFGLSKKRYEYATYVKGNSDGYPLPWRWSAPETLRNFKFSSSSDVWAYGVTLWEIFSFAEVPYTGLSWSCDFLRELEGGLRLTKPSACKPSMFKIMDSCYALDPDDRPTFALLRQNLYFELKRYSTVEYIEIDMAQA